VTAAWASALAGQQAELNRRLAVLETLPENGRLPDGTASVRSAIALIRGLFGFDGPDRMIAESTLAAELECDPASQWYAVARASTGHAAYVRGEVEQARAHCLEAAESPRAPATVRVLGLGLVTLCDLESGDLDSAREMADRTMLTVLDRSVEAVPSSLWGFTAVGGVRLADGDPRGALEVLDEGLQIRRRLPGLTPWPLIYHLVVMVKAAARANRPGLARDLMTELESLARWPDPMMDATCARIASARAELESRSSSGPAAPGDALTRREAQVLRRLRGSQSLREIAADLYVSHNTVKTITSSIYRKLGAHTREDAVSIARLRSLF
jgi:LuxR family maltose regulon positive regulatory protein